MAAVLVFSRCWRLMPEKQVDSAHFPIFSEITPGKRIIG